MSTDRSVKDKAMAAYLRKKGITRNTGQCPRSCGAAIPNGGPALLAHLNTCRGSPRRDPAAATPPSYHSRRN